MRRNLILTVATATLAFSQSSNLVAVISKNVSRTVDLPAELQPFLSVELHAKVSGYVERILVDPAVKQGLRSLLTDVELPLSSVLARMEAHGIRLDVAYLEEIGQGVRDRMATLTKEIYGIAGREFNLNSPPQLREVLYGELGLQPCKKTP